MTLETDKGVDVGYLLVSRRRWSLTLAGLRKKDFVNSVSEMLPKGIWQGTGSIGEVESLEGTQIMR